MSSLTERSAKLMKRYRRRMKLSKKIIVNAGLLKAGKSSLLNAVVLTATLNGFQMNADQAGHINDVLTSIDLESASDAGGIGQALTKVASQANNAGVSLEKTAAMIATTKYADVMELALHNGVLYNKNARIVEIGICIGQAVHSCFHFDP